MRALILAIVVGIGCQPYNVDVYGPIDYVTAEGVYVADNGTNTPITDVERTIGATWSAWSAAFHDEGVSCAPCFACDVYLSWQPHPFEVPPWGLFGGHTEDLRNIWGSGYLVARVVAGEGAMARLAHELGHVILRLCDMKAWESELAGWASRHPGIPY